MKKGCCHNKVSLFLRMDYFSFIFFPGMLILPELISEYLVPYKAQGHLVAPMVFKSNKQQISSQAH